MKEFPRRFVPWKLFTGSFVPNALLRYPHLSPSAKLLWARLAQYAGESGECYPSQETLAEQLGLQKRHIKNLVKELSDKGFIEAVRTSKDRLTGGHNRYYFLWHSVFDDTEVRDERCELPAGTLRLLEEESCPSESARFCPSDGQDSAPPLKENPIKENPIKETKSARALQEEELEKQARGVFDFWVRVMEMGKGTEFASCGRDTKVKARLNKGFTAADLRQAVLGCRASPFHQGENPTGAIYNDLELICRDEKKVRYFMTIAEKAQVTSSVGRIREIRRVMSEINEGAAQALAKQYGIEWERVLAPADLQLVIGGY